VTPATTGDAIEIRLRRAGAISGRVLDDFGEPIISARVTAEAPSGSPSKLGTIVTTETDDRGEYRLTTLPSGSYVVAVTTIATALIRGFNGNVIRPNVQKAYYPGVSEAEAESVSLQAAEDRTGIDFVVPSNLSGNQMFSAVAALPFNPLARTPDRATRATGRVRGRVVDSDRHPLPYTQVVLSSQGMEARVVHADSAGVFEFLELAAGTFQVGASKPAYFPVSVREPATPAIMLADDEKRDDIEITLRRWGTLTGRILDEYGDPMQGVGIQLLQVRYEGGRRRLVAAGNTPTAWGAARVTDDLGAYRLFGLLPGQYIVSTTMGDISSPDMPGYARSYFPGTPTPGDAQYVAVGPGDVAGIDLTLSRTHTARLSGQILNAAGKPTTGGMVSLMPSQRSISVASVRVGARLLDDGRFEFANVTPGQYVIQAYRGRQNSWIEGEFGALAVGVGDTDVADLLLQMSSGSSITGRFSFDTFDPSKQPSRSGIELSPIPVDPDFSPQSNFAGANIHPDGTFEIAGISGPRRLQLLRAPPGWALKEIRVKGVGGTEITDITERALPFGRKDQSLTGVEVVLTDRVSALVGTIRAENARPSPGASLIVFSADRAQWYPTSRFVRKTAAGSDGAFALTGLPSATYYAAAVAQLPPEGVDAWQDPEFLDALIPRASTVTITEGQQLSLNVRVTADTR
jgi:protocatechuate 3,4-dioxygenase beta subunit